MIIDSITSFIQSSELTRLPLLGRSCSFCSISPQRGRVRQSIRGNCFILSAILLLHSSSCNVASDPWCHVFTYLDHDEEDDAVESDHAEDDTEIDPF